jgi:uncharacterized membrane protein YphA (DoxX/SURF4 family)
MNVREFFNKYFVQAASVLVVLLFAYAGVTKLLDSAGFQRELSLSPLIPEGMVANVSMLLPALELVVCALLFFERYTKLAFYAAYFLMLFFTLYILFLLNYSTYIPCSCGGVLGNMSWNTHILFNLLFVILTGAAIFILEKRTSKKVSI